MYAHFDGVVLSRKAEGVPAHRVNDVVALHQLVAAPYVADDVASPVAYVKSVAGGIGEHIQTIIFWFFSVVDIYRVLFPVLAPFFFYCAVIVRCCHYFTLLFLFFGSNGISIGCLPELSLISLNFIINTEGQFVKQIAPGWIDAYFSSITSQVFVPSRQFIVIRSPGS